MAKCEHLARTSAYFDGELADAEHADALAHIAECAECQGLLGAAVAFDAAASKARVVVEEPRPAPRRTRRRWPIAAVAAVAVAAAALLVWYVRPKPEPTDRVAITLPAERAVAARFTGDAFMTHRPYAPLRAGDRPHEEITLGTLAALEQRGDARNLLAALASSGDVNRAAQVAAKLPDDAAAASDRAALSLATRDLESALVYAYRAVDRDPKLSPGWWNLALAARDLGLPRVAKDAFDHVVAAGERGWIDEAKTEVAALERQIAAEDSSDAEKRGRAMLDGGPLLTADDVQRFPALARFYFYDGVRVATSKDDAERLRPLANALDQASGTNDANAAIDRVVGLDFNVRAKVSGKYRELVTRRMNPADGLALIEEARKLGAPAADIFLGVAVFMGQSAKYAAELRAIAAPWHDPWFDLILERDRILAAYPNNDLRAEPELVKALAGCTNPAFQLRCGQLSQALGALLVATGRIEEGEARTKAAVDAFLQAHSPTHFRQARTFLAEIHRRRGRFALARAEFEEEIIAAKAAGACDLARYAEIGRASLAFMARDLERAREFLPPAKPPEGCMPNPDIIGLVAAVDIARITKDPRDATAAREWVEYARASELGVPATIAAARLVPPDPQAIAAVREWLAASKPGYATDALRVLGYSTLISDAGARGAWSDVIDLAKAEYHLTTEPSCLLVTSVDDDKVTVAARIAGELVGEAAEVPAPAPATVPPAIVKKLASCSGIAVIARTQSHGRADLLPPAYPWWFAGDATRKATAAVPRSLEVIDVKPPDVGASLAPLPSLGASKQPFDVTLAGADATPDRVLAALASATYAEIHAHGIVSAANEDAAFLALSPGIDGRFALDAGRIRKAKLTSAPFVVLAACRAAAVASVFRERWSLPDALLVAGARGVVAADAPIPDASARAVLDELHGRLDAGEDPAAALAAIRKTRGGWAAHLMLFR